MSKVGAAKVATKAGPVWCHLSQLGGTTRLRRFSEGVAYDVEIESDEIEEFVPLKDCKVLVQAPNYSVTNADVWTQILQCLEVGRTPAVEPVQDRNASKPIVVPITVLRRFYELIKLLDVDTWENLADFYSKRPASIERLWNQSQAAFCDYRNLDGWGRGHTKLLPPAPASIGAIRSTNEFVAALEGANDATALTRIEGFTFVERELNPRRTRNATYADGRRATNSGAGGIDVLFRSDTGSPGIAEVKVRDDKNAFFALVQAMTYAVELATQNQLTRLKMHFPDQFEKLNPEKAKVEIVLLMVNHVPDRSRDAIARLVTELNRRKKCKKLGKILVVENRGEEWVINA